MKPEEKEYLDMIHMTQRRYHIQTKLFSMIPYAVKFDLYHGHCEMCEQKLESRPMYLLKIPNLDLPQIKYLCRYCAGLHEKYIISFFITKN